MTDNEGDDPRGAPEDAPEEYRRSEYDEYVADLPYGSAWPGGFQVGAGALLLFFGAFLVFVIVLIAAPAGPYSPLLAVVFMVVAIVGFSLHMWSGLGRYIGSARVPSDAVRPRSRR